MSVEMASAAEFPTRFGRFKIYAFSDGEYEHLALVRDEGKEDGSVPVRIHSRCMTGDIFSSLRCDCREQLESALEYIAGKRHGVLIYLDQEGRGIGLCNKVRAYSLQDGGLDTVEANLSLGFAEDLRDYRAAAEILKQLKIDKIRLITNNPQKIQEMKKHGILVVERIPLVITPNEHNKRYLETKKEKMEHMLD
ncbi:MAG: GTP cyclohydrolase II [Candidatus Micrarchaeota archaeon]